MDPGYRKWKKELQTSTEPDVIRPGSRTGCLDEAYFRAAHHRLRATKGSKDLVKGRANSCISIREQIFPILSMCVFLMSPDRPTSCRSFYSAALPPCFAPAHDACTPARPPIRCLIPRPCSPGRSIGHRLRAGVLIGLCFLGHQPQHFLLRTPKPSQNKCFVLHEFQPADLFWTLGGQETAGVHCPPSSAPGRA